MANPDAAAIYCRISLDRTAEALGVARQEADCRAFIDRRGWTLHDVYVDNDTSAYGGKTRPAYRRLLADLTAGTVDAVVVWHLDRLTRTPAELEQFFDLADKAGVRHLHSVTGDVDLGSDDARFLARILGAAARKESDDKSRRLRRKHRELAERGIPVGGTRPFGYEPDKVTVRESEAALIREAADALVAGESLRSVAMRWNVEGVQASRGGRWGQTSLRRVLLSARVVGKRSLHGQVIADGTWPAILDEVTQARLRAVVDDRARSHRGGFGPAHLLTGLLRCGRCGASMMSQSQGQTHPHRRSYCCPAAPSKRGCGGIRIVAEPTEDVVVSRMLGHLSDISTAEPVGSVDDTALVAEIADLETRKAALAADFYVRGDLTDRVQFQAASAALERRVSDAQKALAAMVHRRAAETLAADAGTVAAGWETMELSARRDLLAQVIDRVTVAPRRAPGYNLFDPERLAIVWRV